MTDDTAALVETVLLFAGKNVAPELRGAVAALAQRLADASDAVARANKRAFLADGVANRAEVRAERAEAALRELEKAHQEHLRTGDYARLGMATQDVLRALATTEEPE